MGGDAVAVLDTTTRAQQHRMDIPAVMAAALSPLGTYLITFQRPTKTEGGAGEEGKRWHRGGRGSCTGWRSPCLNSHTLAAGHFPQHDLPVCITLIASSRSLCYPPPLTGSHSWLAACLQLTAT